MGKGTLKTRSVLLALLLSLCAGIPGELSACGNKFLVVSRNTRFKHAPAPRSQAAILLYADPKSNVPRALANVMVDATLRKVGYKPKLCGELGGARPDSRRSEVGPPVRRRGRMRERPPAAESGRAANTEFFFGKSKAWPLCVGC
jgi:hypothetical protein